LLDQVDKKIKKLEDTYSMLDTPEQKKNCEKEKSDWEKIAEFLRNIQENRNPKG